MSRAAAKLKPLAPRPVDNCPALTKQGSSSNPSKASGSMPALRCANANAFAGCNIGVPCSPLEAVTSLDPRDYVWGTPSPQQQQLLFQQFLQMHFLYHLQLSQQQASAIAGAPVSLPLHAFPVPPSHLVAPQHCAMLPGVAGVPGFMPPGHNALVRQPAVLPSQSVSPALQNPPQESSKIQAPAIAVVKEEQTTATQPAVSPASTAGKPASPDVASAAPDAPVPSSDKTASYLDKADLFDCVADFHMDDFDVMLSEHCQDGLPSSGKDQTGGLYDALSVPSPSGSDGSTETLAVATDCAADSPTSHEALSFLQCGLLPLPEESAIASLDYATDFKDVADFEFADLDDVVGLGSVDLGCEQPMLGSSTPQLFGNDDIQTKSNQSRAMKLKKGSGIQKPSNRRNALSAVAKSMLSQAI